MGWEVVPEGLEDLLVRLHVDYAPPAIFVTENGAAFPDVRGHDGSVRDPERQSFLEGYLAAARRAAALGYEGKWAIHPSQIALANQVG